MDQWLRAFDTLVEDLIVTEGLKKYSDYILFDLEL